MSRTGPNGAKQVGTSVVLNKGINNRKSEGGRYGYLKEQRRQQAEQRAAECAKEGRAGKVTGIRSAVRYGEMTPEEALNLPLTSQKLINWLKNRKAS